MKERHVLGMLVEDSPVVLTRITGMFARRGFTIDAITLQKTTRQGVSRVVLATMEDDNVIEQVVKQLNKLVGVIKVTGLRHDESILSEPCFLRVSMPDVREKGSLQKRADVCKVKAVDLTPHSITFQIEDDTGEVSSFMKWAGKYGLRETSRSGANVDAREQRILEKEKGGGE